MRTHDRRNFKQVTLKMATTAATLRTNAYVRFKLVGRDLGLVTQQLQAFAHDAVNHLPPDPYGRGDRNRRHAAALYIDDGQPLRPVNRIHANGSTLSVYHQSPAYNPEIGGVHRLFAALTEVQIQSPVLRAIIDFDYRTAKLAGVLPDSSVYMVGVHITQQAPKDGAHASVVPPFLHRDGEPVTFAHLLGRQNVTGGWTAVASPAHLGEHPDDINPSDILARFTLEQPFDSYAVDDARVAHHADSVTDLAPGKLAHRTMLLIDFRPMRELYTHDFRGS